MERNLHIGGKHRVQGWEILDANAGPAVDHVRNATDLGCFADGTFAQIYASHVIEHFDYKEVLLATLSEWHRVLAPGGRLYASVPDLDVLARLFIDRRNLDVDARYLVMRMMFGGHIDQYDYHLVGLNDEFLAGYLQAAGFVDIQRVERFGIFDDTSNLALNGTLISLNLIARKAERT